MVANRRIFTSFAIGDVRLRDFLAGQARNEKAPFSFAGMSVKEPWADAWKTRCRTKTRGCDGVVGIVTRNTPRAGGQLWELRSAYEERVPVLLIYGYPDDRPANLPDPVRGRRIHTWTWDNIAAFLAKL